MTEQEYIASLRENFCDGNEPTAEVVTMVNQAVGAFPGCAELWLLHAQVSLCATDDDGPHPEVVRSFERALSCDENFLPALDALAVYWDSVRDDPTRAEVYFDRATAVRERSRVQ